MKKLIISMAFLVMAGTAPVVVTAANRSAASAELQAPKPPPAPKKPKAPKPAKKPKPPKPAKKPPRPPKPPF